MTKPSRKPVKFSKREKQVLKMLLEEKKSHEISKELNISDKTVGTFKLRLLGKSGCKTIVGLYRYNQKHNIVDVIDNEIDAFSNISETTQQHGTVSFDYKTKAIDSLKSIYNETIRAKSMFPENFVNQHEAYAVLLEEVDELWDEIKKNQKIYDLGAQRKEATQAAAMIVRLLVELL